MTKPHVSGWSGIGQREVQIAKTSVEPNFGSHQDFIPTTVAVQDSQFSTVQDATVVDIPEVEAEPGSSSSSGLVATQVATAEVLTTSTTTTATFSPATAEEENLGV